MKNNKVRIWRTEDSVDMDGWASRKLSYWATTESHKRNKNFAKEMEKLGGFYAQNGMKGLL